ncbi:MAG: hypothetical protein Kow00108_01950 [Calditrichia bacterium]
MCKEALGQARRRESIISLIRKISPGVPGKKLFGFSIHLRSENSFDYTINLMSNGIE